MEKVALDCVGSHVPDNNVRYSSTLQRRLLGYIARCFRFVSKGGAGIDKMEWALYKLGGLYREQAKLEMAEQICEQALRGWEKVVGLEHTSTLRTVNGLGIVYLDQGKLELVE